MSDRGSTNVGGALQDSAEAAQPNSERVESHEKSSETIQELEIRLQKMSDKDLRQELLERKITGKASAKKQDKIAAIVLHTKQLALYDSAGIALQSHSSFTKNCRFRLLNMLFSEKHCADFACIGARPSRLDLDEGKVGENTDFWQSIAYNWEDHDEYNNLVQTSGIFAGIDPLSSSYLPRDAAKLRGEYLSLSHLYAAALRKFTMSGTHEDEFFNFCEGNAAVYYMRCHLQLKPNLTNVVVTRLDESSSFDSLAAPMDEEQSSQKPKSASSSKKNMTSPAIKVQMDRNKILEGLGERMDRMSDVRNLQVLRMEAQQQTLSTEALLKQIQELGNIIVGMRKEAEIVSDAFEKDELEEDIRQMHAKRRKLSEKCYAFFD